MQADDGRTESGGGLPPQQRWYPARRRLFVTFFGTSSALAAAGVVFVLVTYDGDLGRLMFLAVFGFQSLAFALTAWLHARTWFEADRTGLHNVIFHKRTTYPWDEITAIRPSILKGRTTYLVLVHTDGKVIDLPVAEAHLDELRDWHASATGPEDTEGRLPGGRRPSAG